MSARPPLPPIPPPPAPPAYVPPLTDAELTAMGASGYATVLRLIEEVGRHRRLLARAANHIESAAEIILDDVLHGDDIDGEYAEEMDLVRLLHAIAEGDATWRPA